MATETTKTDVCPRCAAPAAVVTVVTVRTLGNNPRSVLVTRQCATAGCHNKYVVLKQEDELTEDERDRWLDP